MRKVVVRRPGGYDVLRVEHDRDPAPSRGEVAVEVAAAGVNYADCVTRMGLYASARRYVGWPITPGFEFAGTVAAVGDGVDGVREGDAVLGVTRFGAYATRVVVPRAQVFALPRRLDARTGAAFPVAYMTAWFALFELAHPRPGATVLVHSAAGGVGGALVRLARVAGCTVVGVVGASHKADVARAHGAHEVIDASREDLWRAAERVAPRGFDVVLDANGVSTLRGSYAHLASPGKLVVYGFASMLPRGRPDGRVDWLRLAASYVATPRFSPLAMTGENRSVLAFNLSYLFDRADVLAGAMRELLAWLDDGSIAPPDVTATYPLDRAADAHRALESGATTGKLVLLTGGG